MKKAEGMTIHSVRLIHWNADEAAERARKLEACGYEVDFGPQDGPGLGTGGLQGLLDRRNLDWLAVHS